MDVWKITSDLVLTGFLLAAAVQDLRTLRVSNRLILVGMCVAVPLRIMWGGVENIIWILPNILLPVIILYLFYLAGALGAADIKLFSLIGCYLNLRELFYSVVAAFVCGAVFALLKMAYRRNIKHRLLCGMWYLWDLAHGEVSSYEMVDDVNIIHFSIAILVGVLVTLAGGFFR